MDLASEWRSLLSPDEVSPDACRQFAASLREKKLTFGDRLHCPFLRPFLLTGQDEERIRTAAETIASAGERVAQAAMASRTLLHELGMTDPEIGLATIDPGYETASTASRLDSFLLPDSLHFAEYNAESPAGLGYTQKLAEIFDRLPVMAKFRERHAVRYHHTIDAMLAALLASYAEWGGRANPPTIAIVDWHEVPTWTEFEILRDAFVAAGVPTIVQRSPRSGVRRQNAHGWRPTDRSGLQAGAHQRHPEPPRRVSRAGRRLQCPGRLCRQHVPVQAGAQEGVLRRPHRQPARGPLLRRSARGDPRSRALDANPGRHLDGAGRPTRGPPPDRA